MAALPRTRRPWRTGASALVTAVVGCTVALTPTAAFAGQAALSPGHGPAGADVPPPASGARVAWAWGANWAGQLGNGGRIDEHRPFPVAGVDSVTAIAGGSSSGYALRRDGTVWAWGANRVGQLGDGTTTDHATPVRVEGLTEATAIAGGDESAYALRRDGTVWGWGLNIAGQLGNGTTTDSSTPVQVNGLHDVTALAAETWTTYALRRDGTVWAWGSGGNGQLGNNTATASSTPVQVSGLTGVRGIAAGRGAGYAILADGTVRSWGWNYFGGLGDGTTTDSSVPVQVSGLDQVVSLAAGWSSAYAVRRDGTVRSWGYNGAGQLGDGTTVDRRAPVEVEGLGGVRAVTAGEYWAQAVRVDGTAWAWGANDQGQLGDGTTTTSFTPVQVALPVPVTALGAGFQTGYALGSARPRPGHGPGRGAPSARLSVTPPRGFAPTRVTANAAGSAAGAAPLVSYTFDFGDGTIAGPGSSPTATHVYRTPGNYRATATVTDSTGATGGRTVTVPIEAPTGPGIFWESAAVPPGCNHCTAIRIISTGTAPLEISSVTAAENSTAAVTNECPATLPVGDSCVVWWTTIDGRPGSNKNITVHHNAPGGVTTISPGGDEVR
ncbi:PKD domain-containing protein [Frankia canadensis]|nr:PKD domain-containing protein [Frankia canadensis]